MSAPPIVSAPVHIFQKNFRQQVHAMLVRYEDTGARYASLWVFYQAEDGSYKPGNKGLMVALDLLPQLAEAVAALQAAVADPSNPETDPCQP